MAKRKQHKLVYHYYTIHVPFDFSDIPEVRGFCAIAQAEERAKLWIVPCVWTVLWDRNEYVRVRRVTVKHPTKRVVKCN